MRFTIIEHLSDEYEQMIQLRIRVLLQPLGISATYIQPDQEDKDIHLGVFEAGVLKACCVLTGRGEGRLQLRQMAVANDMQGQGLGASLVRFAETVAKENGYTTLYMHARNPVIPFYEKSGYTIAGEEFFEVGIGHHRMEKQL